MNILLIILLMIVAYRLCFKLIDYNKKDNVYFSRDYVTINNILNSNFSDRDKIQILREFINNQTNKINNSKSKTGLKFYER